MQPEGGAFKQGDGPGIISLKREAHHGDKAGLHLAAGGDAPNGGPREAAEREAGGAP